MSAAATTAPQEYGVSGDRDVSPYPPAVPLMRERASHQASKNPTGWTPDAGASRSFVGNGHSGLLSSQGGSTYTASDLSPVVVRNSNRSNHAEHNRGASTANDGPYAAYQKQIGQKVPFSDFLQQWRSKKIHLDSIRNMESHVLNDVKAHRRRVKKFEKYFHNPELHEKVKQFERNKLRRENKSILKRLFQVTVMETEISAANNPVNRLGLLKKRRARQKAIRESNQQKLNYINSENKLLLRRLKNVRGSFDRKKMKSDYKRHIKLRDAMRKVDNPQPNRSGRKRRRRRGKIPKLAGSGQNFSTSLPSLHANASIARKSIESAVERQMSAYQEPQQAMVTIDGRRSLVRSWRDVEGFSFQLNDPETGAQRTLHLTDDEVEQLAMRFAELNGMPNAKRLIYLTSKLPILLSAKF